jgi:hypothetical protein
MPNNFLKELPSWRLFVLAHLVADEPVPEHEGGPFFDELPLSVFEAFKMLVPGLVDDVPEHLKHLWPGESELVLLKGLDGNPVWRDGDPGPLAYDSKKKTGEHAFTGGNDACCARSRMPDMPGPRCGLAADLLLRSRFCFDQGGRKGTA